MITMTHEEYLAVRQLKHFAQWYIQEHEGASGMEEMIKQWEEDRDEVARGIAVLDKLDAQ